MSNVPTATIELLQEAAQTEPYAWFGVAGHTQQQAPGEVRSVAAWQSSEAPTPQLLADVLELAGQLYPAATMFDVLGANQVSKPPQAPYPWRKKLMTMSSAEGDGLALQLLIVAAPQPIPQGTPQG